MRIATRFLVVIGLLLGLGTSLLAETDDDPRGTLRIGVAARAGPHSTLTPLVYWGGFQTKTACYEGLVRVGKDGYPEPGLARSWTVSDDGRVFTLTLRPQVEMHDGSVLDAATVRDHIVRWRGNPSNRWLGSTERIERVEALDDRTVRVTLSEPWPFLEECARAINPAFVVGKGAYDNEGTFVETVGSGPYRLVEQVPNRGYRFAAHDKWWGGRPGLAEVHMLVLDSGHLEDAEKLDVLRTGAVDLVVDGDSPLIPREGLADFAKDKRFAVHRGQGSAVTNLVLNPSRGPFASRAVRRRVQAAIDRRSLVERGELGYATPSTTLFAGGQAGWPEHGDAPSATAPPIGETVEARLLLRATDSARMRRHADLLREQLAAVGVDLVIETIADWQALKDRMASGDYDAFFRTTYGVPYDPWITLQTMFFERPPGETASSAPPLWRDETLRQRLRVAFGSRDRRVRARAFAAAQSRIDEEAVLIPLFVSDRVAISRVGVTVPLDMDGYDLGLAQATADRTADDVSFLGAAAADDGNAPAGAPTDTTTPEGADPRSAEVPLPAAEGWDARLVLDNEGVGIWTVKSYPVFPHLGCPEIVGLDDKGRCHVMVSYSGKWTPVTVLADGRWLGGLAHGDVDPRIDGAEIYTGSARGNVYQVIPYKHGVLEGRLIAYLPGLEIHTIVAGQLDPRTPHSEVLLFTRPGALYLLTPTGPDGRFEVENLGEIPARIRDAIVLPAKAGEAPEIATVARDGKLRLLQLAAEGPRWTTIYEAPMGKGRVSLKPSAPGEPLVLYTTHDDGRILRHERRPDRTWQSETIYLGPQGPRGIAAGRFDARPGVETIAIFGYSHDLELLSRIDGRWQAETIYHDVEKGHWLAPCEVEGRNATTEIVASGFGGRIVLLSRPPGYGREETTGD